MPVIGIAAVAAPFLRDIDDGLRAIEATLATARARGARLVVLPEAALGGYVQEPAPGAGPGAAPGLPRALRADGPELARLARMAGDLTVVVGFTEAGDGDGVVHASAACVGDDGLLGLQRKVHLPPAERFAYAPGDGFAAFDTPLGRLGMLVCYDKLFPEAARALALDGATTICALSAWPCDRLAPARRMRDDRQVRHFDLLDQARAVENQVVWVASNGTGRWGALRFPGGAKIVDPDGVVLARTRPGRAETAVASIDPAAAVAAVRAGIDHLGDRRPAAYAGADRSVSCSASAVV